jgi:hypothetical protein
LKMSYFFTIKEKIHTYVHFTLFIF